MEISSHAAVLTATYTMDEMIKKPKTNRCQSITQSKIRPPHLPCGASRDFHSSAAIHNIAVPVGSGRERTGDCYALVLFQGSSYVFEMGGAC